MNDTLLKLTKELCKQITLDDVGAMIGGIYQGGNGGMLSIETLKLRDKLEREIARLEAEKRDA